jgi:TfoX/Sxy family transcriptional regulator of competence genes
LAGNSSPYEERTVTGGDELFEAVVDAVEHDPAVGTGRMFGSSGLKVGGKIFAMLVKGKLVVKLPKHRVEELIADGSGSAFDPGHGRVMKEWVAVDPSDAAQWLRLAEEARAFVTPKAESDRR